MLINTHIAMTHVSCRKSACEKRLSNYVYKSIYSIQTIKYGYIMFLLVEYHYKDIHGVYVFFFIV